jgi:hypothetical protein
LHLGSQERLDPILIDHIKYVFHVDVVFDLKTYIVLLKSIQKWSICSLQRFLIIVHEYNAAEFIMHETLRIHLSTKSNAAVPFITIDCEILVEKIIERAVDVIFALENDWNAFLNVENNIIQRLESIVFFV